jgi:hypothetical protein
MQDVVAELRIGVKDLAAENRSGWSPLALSDRLRDLVGLSDGFQIEVIRLVADWDRKAAWGEDGAVTAVSWLTHRFPLSTGEATALVRVARLYAGHDVIADALDRGDLPLAHTRVLARAERHREVEFARCVRGLVELGAGLGLKDFTQVVAEWVELVDDRPPPDDSKRRFTSADTTGGSAHSELFGSADDAAIIRAAIEALDTPDPIDAPEGPRSRAQRHYDIAIDIFRRVLADKVGDSIATPASVDVIVDADTAAELVADPQVPLMSDDTLGERLLRRRCSYQNGERARRTFAAALLCTGWVRRILRDPVTGDVLDVGRAHRRFTPRQRRALVVRDGGCVFPGCDRPPKWCDAHHLRPWEDDGPTDLANGCLLCRRHHTVIHSKGWCLGRDPATGVVTATNPDGRTFTRRPGERC